MIMRIMVKMVVVVVVRMLMVVVRSTPFYEVRWCLLAYVLKCNVLLNKKVCSPET